MVAGTKAELLTEVPFPDRTARKDRHKDHNLHHVFEAHETASLSLFYGHGSLVRRSWIAPVVVPSMENGLAGSETVVSVLLVWRDDPPKHPHRHSDDHLYRVAMPGVRRCAVAVLPLHDRKWEIHCRQALEAASPKAAQTRAEASWEHPCPAPKRVEASSACHSGRPWVACLP